MKKIHLLLLGLTICLFTACHNDIWDAIDGLDSRVTKLEELCKEMNTNITSLQTIVDVLQSNDFITGVVEIKKDGEVIGYTITFGKHDPITIYHGQDGKDGADGKDGQDGQNGSANTPVIGVAQDIDGVYYWTLNGEWLLDDNGNKLPVSGKDGQNGTNGSNGQDGADGEDGKDGADGQDGKDGITPQLKIEDGYWYISYDNGATWTQLGKATGEDGQDGKDGADGEDGKDGQNGADGKDGQDGDSMFQSVTQDENYVYFMLADGTVIKIAKGKESTNQTHGFYNNHEFVDLGLPSGTKWAKENVDGYYCFGGISSNVLISDTIFINGKALTEGDSICGTVYDVATLEWGKGWQIPTKNDFQELIDNCTVSYLSEEGMRLKSKINGKVIFFQFDILPSSFNHSYTIKYLWQGQYLSSTAYGGLYIDMERYYHGNFGGWEQDYSCYLKTFDQHRFYLIRPVLKD